MGTEVAARGEAGGGPLERPLRVEVRQSLSLLGLTAAAMAFVLGVGLLAVRVLG